MVLTLLYPTRDYITVEKIMSEPGFTGLKDLQDDIQFQISNSRFKD
jgi:hypothetical protein